MSTRRRFLLALPLALLAGAAIAAEGPGLGKPISEADLALWDISVGPDGKGLPPGSGSAAQGAAIFAQKCEACHGKDGYGGRKPALAHPPGNSGPHLADYLSHPPTTFCFNPPSVPPPT